MNDMLYLSRSFVEFGPFSPAEIHAFYQRGMLKDSDYVRHSTGDDWVHVNDWASKTPAPAAAAPASVEKAPAKKAAAPKVKAAAPAPAAAKPAVKKTKKA